MLQLKDTFLKANSSDDLLSEYQFFLHNSSHYKNS